MIRLGAWIGVLILTLYLVFVGGGWLGLYEAPIRLATAVLGASALGVWILVGLRKPAWRPQSALLPVIGAALISLTLSTIVSRHPRQSVEYLAYAVLLSAFYLLLVRLIANPFFRARFSTFAVAGAFALGGAFAAMNFLRWINWWSVVGRITLPPLRPESESLTYGNPSAAMTIVLLFVCSAIAVTGVGTWSRRIVVGFLAALATFAIVVSGSRSGWFAVGLAVVVIAALWLSDPARRHQTMTLARGAIANTRARLGLATLGVAGLGALAVLAPLLIRRATDSGADLRLNYVLAAQRMFAEAPILGVGPGSWVIEHIRYTQASETLYYIPHAHNVYAQTGAELGVVGIVVGLFMLVCIASLIGSAIRDPNALRRRWGWAAAFSFTYFALHQVLDFYPNMPAILFAAAMPIAWLDGTTEQPITLVSRQLPNRLGRRSLVFSVGILILAAGGTFLTEIPAGRSAAAVDLANNGQWSAADVEAQEAVSLDPAWPSYLFTMGLTASNVGDHIRAAAAFRKVAESDDVPEAWLDLAAEEDVLGNNEAALEALTRAARLGLQRTGLAMAIGDLAARLGDLRLSDDAFALAISRTPSLAGDGWWQASPERAAQLLRVVDQALPMALPANRWEIALMAGQLDRARALVASTPDNAGAFEDTIIKAWTGDEDAFHRVLALCSKEPLNVRALGWAARLEGQRGQIDEQNRYLRWAFTIGSTAGTEIRVSDRQMIGRTAQGDVGEFWGTYTYRRPTPWNLLVPSLVQLTIE